MFDSLDPVTALETELKQALSDQTEFIASEKSLSQLSFGFVPLAIADLRYLTMRQLYQFLYYFSPD